MGGYMYLLYYVLRRKQDFWMSSGSNERASQGKNCFARLF
jgi:hypothetical protein